VQHLPLLLALQISELSSASARGARDTITAAQLPEGSGLSKRRQGGDSGVKPPFIANVYVALTSSEGSADRVTRRMFTGLPAWILRVRGKHFLHVKQCGKGSARAASADEEKLA